MSLQLWIANKNYSSWSLRPWFLLKALNIPFDEQLATFVPVALRARTYQLSFSAAAQAWIDRIVAHPAIIEWCEAAAKEEKIAHD